MQQMLTCSIETIEAGLDKYYARSNLHAPCGGNWTNAYIVDCFRNDPNASAAFLALCTAPMADDSYLAAFIDAEMDENSVQQIFDHLETCRVNWSKQGYRVQVCCLVVPRI
jgi:hypothetical protein